MYIGVQGFIGSGKDTASRYIESKEDFVKDSFATSLKDACASIFGWPRDLLEGRTDHSREWREQVDVWWEEKLGIEGFSPRFALQHIGTELFRDNFHQDTWMLTFLHRLEHKHRSKNVILSDCRFKNEISMFKRAGGKIMFIDNGERPEWYETALNANSGNADALDIMLTTYKNIHRSEWDWIGTKPDIVIMNDYKVKNDQSLADFYRKIDYALEESLEFI